MLKKAISSPYTNPITIKLCSLVSLMTSVNWNGMPQILGIGRATTPTNCFCIRNGTHTCHMLSLFFGHIWLFVAWAQKLQPGEVGDVVGKILYIVL